MIIFGWGHRTQKDYGNTYPIHCSHCNNTRYFRLVRVMVWFELFFVPVLPYKINHYLLCPICLAGIDLEDKKLDYAKELNEITLKYLDKQMTEKQYNDKLDIYDKLLISDIKQEKE